METKPETKDALNALRYLTLEEVEQRITEINGERASLSLLRRSLLARKRAERKSQQRSVTQTGGPAR